MSTPAILRHRRDTAANWTSNNPVLEAGQIGYETDTRRFKFGNGSTAWTSLAYGVGALADGDVTYPKIQDTTAGSVLLGRGSSGAGDVQEISLGSGLVMTGTELSATGGGGGAPSTADYLVKTADAGLSAERVVTDSTSISANWSTAGQVAFQRAALTGDVTATANSNATTIANAAVSYAKIQNVSATDKVLGRSTAGAGSIEEITCTAAGRALLDDADASAQRTTLGLGTLATQSGTFSGTSSGTNTGDQTITLTGDVTGSGTGSFAATIASGAVSTSKLGGDITTAGKALLDDADASAQRTTLGLGTLATQSGTFSGTSSGTNTGDQTITLTGDVTGSGTGSFAATIANDAVTNAKLANVATSTIKGRVTAGTGDPEDLTGTQATTLLDAFTSSLKGLAPASGGGTSNFLRADGTWAAPAGGGGGGTKTYAVFTPLANQPPATAFATLDTRNSIAVLDFDDGATNEAAIFNGIIPEAASLGSGLKVRIIWTATTATSGATEWGVQFEKLSTDIDSDSFDTAATQTTTTNGTSGVPNTTEITITTIDSLAAGDGFRLKIYRDSSDATNDTMTGDAELIAVEVRSAS